MLWALPLVMGIAFAALAVFDGAAWAAALSHPQLSEALVLAVFIGAASLAGSLLLALTIAASFYDGTAHPHGLRFQGLFLSLPHLALAIGLGFLIMPSGLIARFIATLFTGWDSPPSWVTTQDPLGLSLIAALILKETPFLLWAITSVMARGDTALAFQGQWRSARSLGHGPRSIWSRVLAPQIIQLIRWPIVIVFIYGATVVDMALVIGPTQPPPYGLIAWADLNDADALLNNRGAVATLLLTALLGLACLAAALIGRWLKPALSRYAARGPTLRLADVAIGRSLFLLLIAIYSAVTVTLFIVSMSASWPFPALLPPGVDFRFWGQLLESPAPLAVSVAIALLTSGLALLLAVLWFESFEPRHDGVLVGLAVLALALPQIMLVSGQYALFLRLHLNETWLGVLVAHFTPVFAYLAVVLIGPYRSFDRRLQSVSYGLNCSAWRFWAHVKRPLLLPSLAAAGAVGFAVSMGQYLPAQLVGGGQFATLPVETVTLSSGGNRPLLAVYALAMTLPPLVVFLLAQRASRVAWARP